MAGGDYTASSRAPEVGDIRVARRALPPLVGPPTLRRCHRQSKGRPHMSTRNMISHAVMGCAGVFAGYVIATGQLGIGTSLAQAPAGQRGTELFNRVMDDV